MGLMGLMRHKFSWVFCTSRSSGAVEDSVVLRTAKFCTDLFRAGVWAMLQAPWKLL
jgi:hypothetical protein